MVYGRHFLGIENCLRLVNMSSLVDRRLCHQSGPNLVFFRPFVQHFLIALTSLFNLAFPSFRLTPTPS